MEPSGNETHTVDVISFHLKTTPKRRPFYPDSVTSKFTRDSTFCIITTYL